MHGTVFQFCSHVQPHQLPSSPPYIADGVHTEHFSLYVAGAEDLVVPFAVPHTGASLSLQDLPATNLYQL